MKCFKQKALIAALAGVSALAATGAANAVYVNNDGLGQVLVYPYYTVRGGNNTLISVVNTTDKAKAVKVRFVDGKNTSEVLDFNLFLSPKDVWTGAVVATTAGAKLITADKSCTNPKIPAAGVDFRNFQFVSDGDASGLLTLDRTREGYLEMIEMATIDTASVLGKDVTHVAGTPACKLVSDASATTASGLSAPSSGLFGNLTVFNAAGGYSSSVDATAFEGFWASTFTGRITASGLTTPNLSSGGSNIAVVNDRGNVYVSQMATPLDAVSATIMHSAVLGEYAFTSDGVIGTDWVVTMPTKREYVFNGGGSNRALGPFENAWSGKLGLSCDAVILTSTDREEYIGQSFDDFSPKPPNAPGNALCYEANVIGFGASSSATASSVLGSTNFVGISPVQNQGTSPVPVGKEGGWLELTFDTTVAAGRRIGAVAGSTISTATATAITPVAQVHTYVGLPVVGFSISQAVLSSSSTNYNSSAGLRFKRSIISGSNIQ